MKTVHAAWALAAGFLFLPPPALAADCTISKIADLPITMDGLRPIVDAKINGTPLKFLADSGAFYSLISPSVAAELKLSLAPTPINFQLRGIGGGAMSSVTTVRSFGLAGVDIPNVQFLVGGSDTGRAGLLGQNVLGLGDVEYDLAGGMIRLFKTKGCFKSNLAYWAKDKPVQVIDLITSSSDTHTNGTVMVNGIKMRAVFDTGAPTSMLTLRAAQRAGVKPTDPEAKPAGFSRGLGRNVTQSWIAPFKSLAIGDEQISKIKLRFADLSDVPFDMLIGADFFLSHHIFVSKATSKIFLTYNGGPVFDLSGGNRPQRDEPAAPEVAGGSPDPAAPADADGFARRGNARAARRDFVGALADLTRAIALAPDDPTYLFQRAEVRLASGQPLLARTDLDAAIRLKPDHVEALMTRARLFLASGHRADALADLDAAARAAPKEADLRLRLAQLYDGADAHEQAIGQYDLWLAVHHHDDSHQPDGLNGRCWSRAMLGRELDKALADCNGAVRAAPKAAGYLDSRGLVWLRMGQLDKAIADYDAALAIQPRIAWSLYGRGLAEQRKGMKAEGDADIAAALAITPGIAEQARKYGIVQAPAG